jgi:hypothetical protein
MQPEMGDAAGEAPDGFRLLALDQLLIQGLLPGVRLTLFLGVFAQLHQQAIDAMRQLGQLVRAFDRQLLVAVQAPAGDLAQLPVCPLQAPQHQSIQQNEQQGAHGQAGQRHLNRRRKRQGMAFLVQVPLELEDELGNGLPVAVDDQGTRLKDGTVVVQFDGGLSPR